MLSYNSNSLAYALGQGSLWRDGYARRIERAAFVEPPLVNTHRPDGKHLAFNQGSTPGSWIGDADVAERLVEHQGGDGKTVGYSLYAAGGEVERYDAAGLLSSIVQADGRQIALQHSTAGIRSVSDDYGRTLTMTVNANGLVTELRGPADERYAFAYNANNQLAGVTYPDGHARTFHYENGTFPNKLTGITDEGSVRFATYRYDTVGRAIGSEHAGGVNKNGLVFATDSTTVTDPLGTNRTYNFQTILGVVKNAGVSQPGGSGCGAASSAITYDANGNVARRTDFNGVVTSYQYDLSRNLETSRTEAAGTAEARTITTAWHQYWRQPIQVSEPGRSTTWTYNGDGGSYCAPPSATVPSINGGTQPIGVVCEKTVQSGGDTRTWRWTYNAYGRPLTEDGPRTDVADLTTYTYWPADASCPGADLGPGRDKGCRGERASTTNALGHVTRFTRYNAHGQLEESIDPNGVVTTIAHDLRQRPVSISVGGETTTYAYDPVGQLIRLSLPDGNVLTYTWDDAHRLTGIADAAGNRVVYTLDAAGNRIGEDFYDGGGQLARAISRSIDALGRVQAVSGLPFLQP